MELQEFIKLIRDDKDITIYNLTERRYTESCSRNYINNYMPGLKVLSFDSIDMDTIIIIVEA